MSLRSVRGFITIVIFLLVYAGCTGGAGTETVLPGTVIGMTAIDDIFDDPANNSIPSSQGGDIGGSRDWSEYVFARPPYAYVAANEYGMAIVNTSDPFHPWVEGQYDSFTAYGVWVSPDFKYAYIADSNRGLKILDISNIKNPLLVNEIRYPDSGSNFDLYFAESVNAIDLSGRRYLLVGTGTNFVILDITDHPENPDFIYGTSAFGAGSNIKIRGTRAILSNGDIRVVDLANINAPLVNILIPKSMGGGSGADLVEGKDVVVVSRGSRGLMTFDVSNPSDPVPIQELDEQFFGTATAQSQGLMVKGDTVYAALGWEGLAAVRINDDKNADLLWIAQLPDLDRTDSNVPYAMNSYVEGKYVYVPCKSDGLRIVVAQ